MSHQYSPFLDLTPDNRQLLSQRKPNLIYRPDALGGYPNVDVVSITINMR